MFLGLGLLSIDVMRVLIGKISSSKQVSCYDVPSFEAGGMYQESPVPLLSGMPVPGSLSRIKQVNRQKRERARTHTDIHVHGEESLAESQATVAR